MDKNKINELAKKYTNPEDFILQVSTLKDDKESKRRNKHDGSRKNY